MKYLACLLLATSFMAVAAEVSFIDHDQVKPFAQLEPTTVSEKAAIKYKPQLLVSYGCHPYPAVQADGSVSRGLEDEGEIDEGCKGGRLGSQVYARSHWYKDTWAIMYAWYLPKGFSRKYQTRNFWEVAVVWIDNLAVDNSALLGVSLNRGVYLMTESSVEAEFVDGSSIKLESTSGFGSRELTLGLTEEKGELQDLVTWEQLTDEARDALKNAEFDTSFSGNIARQMPFKDDAFYKHLEEAWPF